MHNQLIDNSSEQLSMSHILKQCIETSGINKIQIATGYWDIPGMSLIVDELETFLQKNGTVLQLLIGRDPYVYANQLKSPKYKDAQYPYDYIRTDINALEFKEEYQKVISLLLSYCLIDKVQIRIYQRDKNQQVEFLHSKCYIFSGPTKSYGIIGSSNFTQKGLQGNAELNYLETDGTRITAIPRFGSSSKGHICWFEEKWALSCEWTKEFLEQILKPSEIVQKIVENQTSELTPYELYIKLLQCKFGDLIDRNLSEILESYLPKEFDVFEYQIDAVKQCYNIMKEHGGFMLSDVVGLGKTVVGMLLIKHFLTMPEEDGRERKVLIITPPAIQRAWKETIELFDVGKQEKIALSVDFITMGSIGKLVDEIEENIDEDLEETDSGEFAEELFYKNYGFILIDESHRFRNKDTQMYEALDALIGQIGIEEGVYPYVGLLSATPQNNRPDDLKNQIYLFQRNRTDSTLRKADGGNLERFFADISRQYQSIIGGRNDLGMRQIQSTGALKILSQKVRDCVLQDILVRRTRTDIQKYYPETPLTFPEINGPNSIEYRMSKSLALLFSRTMDCIAPKENFLFDDSNYLCYYRYRAIEFLKSEEARKLYSGRNMEVHHFSRQLARIMQIGLVKRIESSFSAFKTSLKNLRRYTQNMVDMWEHNTIFICPQIDVNAELNPRKNWERTGKIISFDACIEDIRKKIAKLNTTGRNIKGRNKEYTQDDFEPTYIELLRQDLMLIQQLDEEWSIYSDDPKLDEFKKQLLPNILDISRNPSQKLVVFTEAIDTVRAIERAIESVDDSLSVLAITAKNRKEKEQIIRANFDANYKGEQRDDYQIIITTEVLAEGINLHRANSILNYDTPWNSTRLMQRIGRVNRIGSMSKCVYVYNFMPSAEGDAEINLVKKAHTKLQSFHSLFGEDSQIFSQQEEIMHHELKTQIDGRESVLEKYFYELKSYKEKYPDRYDYIAQKTEGLELAISSEGRDSLFLVRTPKFSGMLVRYSAEEQESIIISASEMYERFRTGAIGAVPTMLPHDWYDRKANAILAVNRALTKMNIQMKKSARANEAKKIVNQLKDMDISVESKKLLANARRLIDKGNPDIIKRIIGIGGLLQQKHLMLLPITQGEVDEIINSHIQAMVERVSKKFGIAEVFIGFSL